MKHYYQGKKAFLLSLLAFVAANVVMAAPRSVQQAKLEALQLMNRQTGSLSRGQQAVAEPQLVFSKAKKNAADGVYYYVFSSGKNLGFTIVSGDDRLPAIVGYTGSGDYDADNLPENFVSFMQAYQDYVDNASTVELEEANRWRATAAPHADVAPFVASKWNQQTPYNNMCPTLNGTKCVTGCVATALSQILYYYKHPVSLQANIPGYTINYTDGSKISVAAVSAGETYDWDNMLDVYTGNETEAQNNAVAKLMLHVGSAVQMKYSPSSSGAAANKEHLVKYFGMDKELTRFVQRKWYDIVEWDDMLYKEMIEKRPVFYSGQSNGGGHAFVVHGYSDGFYYVNWGWGGMCDGYFDITLLNPNNTTGAGASSSKDGYSMSNDMIIGIQPDNGVVDNVDTPLLSAINDVEYVSSSRSNKNLEIRLKVSMRNNNMMDGNVYVGVGCKADDGKYVNLVSGGGFKITTQQLAVGGNGANLERTVTFSYVEDKVYKLTLIESQDGNNWIPCEGAEATALAVKVSDNSLIRVTDQVENLKAVAELGEDGYANMSNKINITVANTGNKEYYERVYVRASNSDVMPGSSVYITGITAPVGGSTTFSFDYTPATEGNYTFWILDAKGREIGKNNISFQTTTAPKLSFVSITCDSVSGNVVAAYYKGYSANPIEMDVVYGDTASFTFKIRNDGGYYRGMFVPYEYNPSAHNWVGKEQKILTIPADTTVAFTFTTIGHYGELAGIWLVGSGVTIQDLPKDSQNKHYIYEDGKKTAGYVPFSNYELVYLEDPILPVRSIKADDTSLNIASGKGVITVAANVGTDVRIVNMGGMEVARFTLNAGEQTTVNVPAGIYVVNHTKVIVR